MKGLIIMISYVPCKTNPINIKFLKYLHGLLNDASSFELFLESRDNIFVCVDATSAFNMYECDNPAHVYSFLTCRMINASNDDNKQLKIHCKPHNIVYMIDHVYFSDYCCDNDRIDMLKSLMRINEVSKLDTSIVIKLPENQNNILEKILLNMGYYKSETTDNDTYTYFKSPII